MTGGSVERDVKFSPAEVPEIHGNRRGPAIGSPPIDGMTFVGGAGHKGGFPGPCRAGHHDPRIYGIYLPSEIINGTDLTGTVSHDVWAMVKKLNCGKGGNDDWMAITRSKANSPMNRSRSVLSSRFRCSRMIVGSGLLLPSEAGLIPFLSP